MQYYLFQTSSYIKLTTHDRRYVVTKKKTPKPKKKPETPLPPPQKKTPNIQTQKILHRVFLSCICDGRAVQIPKSKSVSGRYPQEV